MGSKRKVEEYRSMRRWKDGGTARASTSTTKTLMRSDSESATEGRRKNKRAKPRRAARSQKNRQRDKARNRKGGATKSAKKGSGSNSAKEEVWPLPVDGTVLPRTMARP